MIMIYDQFISLWGKNSTAYCYKIWLIKTK